MSLITELNRRNVIRVIVAYVAGAWLLIQVADTVFPAYGLPPGALTALITMLVIGLVPVAIISWVFELTPEGLKRDADVAPAESIAPRTGKRLDRIIMVVLAMGVGFFAFDKFVLDPARDAALEEAAEERGRTDAFVRSYGDKSIAVLPFTDLSPAGDHGYFSDGVAEEILNLLAQVRELRVISRSSAFRYRGDVHIPTVAEDLDVSYVLEGSVRSAGDRVRVTAQLIDARADAHVWSDTFDRDLEDIFEVQDEIARSIVDGLQVPLLARAPQSARTDPETFALYLQARYLWFTEGRGGGDMEELLQQALQRDPDYVPALNLMVQAIYNHTGDSDQDGYTVEESIPLMRSYVDRALALDPGNSEALAHRGWMAFLYGGDLETGSQYINRALANDPGNLWALYVAMVISLKIGHNGDAIRFAEAGLDREPRCGGCLYNLMKASFRSGQLDTAQAAAERRLRLTQQGGYISLGDIHLFKGEIEEALELYDRQKEDPIGWLRARATAFHAMQAYEARDEALAQLMAIDQRWAYVNVARVHAWIGNVDESFAWLARYLDPESPDFLWDLTNIFWDPFFRNLQDDPRWRALREDVNMTEERLSKIRIEMPP